MDADSLAERIVSETEATDPPDPATVAEELRRAGVKADMFRVPADNVVTAYAEALKIREEGAASGFEIDVETELAK